MPNSGFARHAAAFACVLLAGAALAQPCDRARFVIALDPGHSVANPGATSARGVPEVRFNRALAHVVRDALVQAGFIRTFLTNDGQDEISLTERAGVASEHHADVFLSIHHDAVQPRYLRTWRFDGKPRPYSDRYSGYSLFVSQKNAEPEESARLAALIGSELRSRCLRPTRHHAEPISGEGRELIDPVRGIYRFDDLVVLKSTRMPAVLFEAGLIVNRNDERLLESPAHRALLAGALTRALAGFCAHEDAAATATSGCAEADAAGGTGARR
jgi:N-acetylmuramoyl-L-alanine amidase